MDISAIASSASNVNSAGVGYMASLKVLNMASNVFEEAAEELIDAMNAMITGLGRNIDVTV